MRLSHLSKLSDLSVIVHNRVSFDIQCLDWDNQPIGEPIHYDGVVIRRRELEEDVIMLETKKIKNT